MSRYAIRSSLAALGFIVAAAGLSGTALAASDTAPPAAAAKQHDGMHGDRHGDHRGGHFKHGDRRGGPELRDSFWVPGVGPLSKEQVASLKLDAKQQATFDTAKQAQGDFFKSMRENRGKRHELLQTQIQNGKLDPHALTANEDAQRAEFRKQSEQVRGKWLAAWDSLNATQQQQVTDWVKARQAKMEAHRAKKAERLAKRDAAKAEKANGDVPPPPPAPSDVPPPPMTN
ncbi:hypothetical protein [Bordetella genomosp. 4]|uniref:LTXXQ motif family protein n=1 Tax=Bordetella genomosp. 4 TaxID=463044 RepID=A0A261U4N6_9BORD|nr:hypothetical protein [Bordetella genomosp. 4]OZI49758.1 hypothetical protein CAL21_09370 [Bordetella genomosp. 4]OZI56200.1 hypothetical protein CAL20_12205 [Bordetella genomosp. 4]